MYILHMNEFTDLQWEYVGIGGKQLVSYKLDVIKSVLAFA